MDLIEFLDSLTQQEFNSLLTEQSLHRDVKKQELGVFNDKLTSILQYLSKIRKGVNGIEKKTQFNSQIDCLTQMYEILAGEWETIFILQKHELEEWLDRQPFRSDWERVLKEKSESLDVSMGEMKSKWVNLQCFLNKMKF